jgi:hypothetical protein
MVRMTRRFALGSMLAIAGLLAVVVACGGSSLKSAGTSCSGDSQCAAGLSCLAVGAFTEAGCAYGASACTRPCTIASDCAPLGADFQCFASCDGTLACGLTK